MKRDYIVIIHSFKQKLTEAKYQKLINQMQKKGFHLESRDIAKNEYTFIKFYK